jgi:plasmid stabilization system protein ParE
MGLRICLHRQARSDLRDIKAHLLEVADKHAAERVRRHLVQKIERLAKFPLVGIVTSDPLVRVLSPTRYPYRRYYTVSGESVIVLHIRHTFRDLPELDDLR